MALIQTFGNIDSEIEILFDSQNQPWFKRADFGRFLELKHIVTSIPDDMKDTEQKMRSEIPGVQSLEPRFGLCGGGNNHHDNFISIKLALLIAMRSTKTKAVQARDWLISEVIPRGFNKIIIENQKALEDKNQLIGLKHKALEVKDTVIALLNDNISTLIKRCVPNAVDSGKDNILIIIRKHTNQDEDKYHNLPYYIARIQKRSRYVKLRWFQKHFPDHEIIVELDNPNSIHVFNRFEEEGHTERKYNHFGLIDLVRDDLYSMGIPGIEFE